MFNRITQCPHFKDRIKHVTFVIAVLIIVAGIWECGLFRWSEPQYDEFMFWLLMPFLIFFFLWKTNYFVRNK